MKGAGRVSKNSAGAGKKLAAGAGYATGAYVWWGAMPVYFIVFTGLGALDVLAWRVIFSLLLCLILVTVLRQWSKVTAVLGNGRDHALLALAGLLIGVNWGTYIYATTSGQVLAASLGYFINPLATIALGVIVLRERLRKLQWVAIGIATIAVVVLTIEYGAVPWISLLLAGSFALYGLVKNQVGGSVDSLTGLTVENMWLSVPAAGWVVFGTGWSTMAGLGQTEPWRAVALSAAGIVTVVPLLLFASASSRLPLSAVGMFQFFSPILQFLLGYFVFGEDMSPGRWWGFGIVWVAVAVLLWDMVRTAWNQKNLARL